MNTLEQRDWFPETSNVRDLIKSLWKADDKKRYRLKVTVSKNENGYTWSSIAWFANMTDGDCEKFESMVRAKSEVRDSGFIVTFEKQEQ